MTIGYLRERLVYWQAVLGIPQWTISLRWGSQRDMEGDDGDVTWTPEYAVASIRIARAQDHHEWSLVHELLHVRLEGHKPMPSEEDYDPSYELALNDMARAYFELDKGK